MVQQMTKEKVLKYMGDEHRYLENHLSQLTPEQISQPNMIGRWAIRDYLAVYIGWEKLALTWIESYFRGEKPDLPAPGYSWHYKDIHVLDETFIDEYKDLSLDDLMDKWRASYRAIRSKTEAIPEEAFLDLELFPRQEAGPLGRLIAANTAWHYRKLKGEIRKWMQEQDLI